MDKIYDQTKAEEKWYKFWEDSGFFKPEVNPDGKPYTIILPPPNANADLHFGHAMMSIEDILIRFKRMQGYSTLWLPGSDHAGIETQVVFEKHLAKEGKSRFDYDRETLYKMIFEFVQKNKGNMEHQLRRMGFSVDWSREKFTLDPDVIKLVYQTFKKLFDEDLVYRANRLVNYCTKMGTGFSDLEVLYIERKDKLYFIRYPFLDGSGSITIATTRPETMFGDTAVAVNPDDDRYKNLIGQTISLPLTDRHIKIVADKDVQTEFGTGAVKITPAHDPLDFTIGERNGLESITVIGFDGKLNAFAGKFNGSSVEVARSNVVAELESLGLVEKIEDYTHRVGTCYKCGKVLEPLLMEQWFLNVQELKQKAIEAVKNGQIRIHPKNFEVHYFQWLENLKDWNISRQPVWGIRIPAYNCIDCHKWTVTDGDTPSSCSSCGSENITQDTDTFDTWFSSGQWPVVTLKTGKPGDFEKFYPTSVMETGYDILKAWVSRMVMLGLYVTGEAPFTDVVLHGLVRDPLGAKMSKSKGNVVSPMEVVDQYGADAARMALVYGTALGHDQNLSHPKLQAMRNFTNKLWNIGRFIIDFAPADAKHLFIDSSTKSDIAYPQSVGPTPEDEEILKKLKATAEKITKSLDDYRFHDGAEALYEFIWHDFADKYIESTKERRGEAQPVLEYVYRTSLELLHPYMPFITEELWQKLPHTGDSIMTASWPDKK